MLSWSAESNRTGRDKLKLQSWGLEAFDETESQMAKLL